MSLPQLSVTVHVLAAMVWIGGMLAIALVGAPVLRDLEDHALRARLFSAIGLRFRAVAWTAIAALLATGIVNLRVMGLLDAETLGSSEFWSTPLGVGLAAKLTLAVLMIGLAGVHDFWLGPAASRTPPESAEARRLRRLASWVARVNALLAVVLVWVAVGLTRG